MKKIAKLQMLLLSAVLFILNNCSMKVSEQAVNHVAPPFENVNVAFHENTIEPLNGGTIKLDNGTKIIIPKYAFKDAEGNIIKSKVKIQYREFHNSAQILLSGIPMKYNNENFQTAGMFEVKGITEDNKTVQLAEGKSMIIQMASFVKGEEYNFYFYDEQKGGWILKGNSPVIENAEKKIKLADLPITPSLPLKPQRQQANSLVFDLDVNTSMYPELRNFNGVVWQYAGNDSESDPAKKPWVFNEKWSYVELNRSENGKGKYLLHLRNSKRDYTAEVTPVLNGKYYRQALARFEKSMDEYEISSQDIRMEEDRLSKEADLLRTFSVNNMGIYNWDCFYKNQPNVVTFNADFKLNEQVPGVNMENINVYLLTGDQRAVVTYNKYYKQNFTFNPSDVNKLVAVLPGDRIAIFRNEDFKNLAAQFQPGEKSTRTIILKVIDQQVVTAENLYAVLATI